MKIGDVKVKELLKVCREARRNSKLEWCYLLSRKQHSAGNSKQFQRELSGVAAESGFDVQTQSLFCAQVFYIQNAKR